MGKIIKYTEQELEIIRNQYPSIGAIGVAALTGRSADSVKFMAYRMGIKVSKQYISETTTRTNKTWKRSDETRKRIGIGHRKHEPFLCKECGKHCSHYTEKCWSCFAGKRREHVPTAAIARRMLYPVWIIPIMVRDEFMCQKCGSSTNLVVHHLRKFSAIMKIVIKISGLTMDAPEKRLMLAKLIVLEHTLDDGITSCRKCHKETHGKKQGELQENLTAKGEGNLQPSRGNVLKLVPRKVQRVTGEDAQSNKLDTSALSATMAL
jgi:hypothetical protein